MSRRFPWADLPDKELLQVRLKDLHVGIEGTWLEDRIADLHEELERRGFRIRPHFWVSSEWFSTEETPGIAVPFYLNSSAAGAPRAQDDSGGRRLHGVRVHAHSSP